MMILGGKRTSHPANTQTRQNLDGRSRAETTGSQESQRCRWNGGIFFPIGRLGALLEGMRNCGDVEDCKGDLADGLRSLRLHGGERRASC